MTLIEQAIFFEKNDWVQGVYTLVEKVGNEYLVWHLTHLQVYALIHTLYSKEIAFSMYIRNEAAKTYERISSDSAREFKPVVKRPIIFTEAEEMAIALLGDTPGLLDLVKDVITRGK